MLPSDAEQPVDFSAALQGVLATLLPLVAANAGYIRLSPPDSQSRHITSAVGLSADFLQREQLACDSCHVCSTPPQAGVYAFGMGNCQKRNSDCFFGEAFKTVIFAPLENAQGQQFGTLSLFFLLGQSHLPEHALRTVQHFVPLLATLVDYQKNQQVQRRAELLSERKSIANEIHDSLAQTLMYARMRANLLIEAIRTCNELVAAQYAHDIDETLENCQKTVRSLITDFRAEIDPSGLLQSLVKLVQQFSQRHSIALDYTNRVAQLDLPLEHEIQIYHIVREALNNIATHSGASHARLLIDTVSNNYVFTIEDNGRGGYTFTPVEGHYGMLIMRERAARIGGDIKIESSAGMGTLVQLFIPSPTTRGETE